MPIISSPGEEEQQTEHTQCGKSHDNQLLFVQVRQNDRTILSPIRGNFLLLVVHREQRNRHVIRMYTEGGGVAIVGVRFMLYIREQDKVFSIRGHIRYCKE